MLIKGHQKRLTQNKDELSEVLTLRPTNEHLPHLFSRERKPFGCGDNQSALKISKDQSVNESISSFFNS